jgi:hypothetical protein
VDLENNVCNPNYVRNSNWPIEMTLTNRDSMGFPNATRKRSDERRVLVDPENNIYWDNQHLKA